MESLFKGKKVLITGSSKGIGFHIADAFYRLGGDVILNGRNEKELTLAKNRLPGSNFYVADITNPTHAQNLAKSIENDLGGLDILICNVGSGKSVLPGNENNKEWKAVFDTNFYSATNIIESSINLLSASNGSIVCISSICGQEVIEGAPITYSCAKAALNHYIKAVSRPFGELNVRINGVAPGNIIFKGSTWEEKLETNFDQVQKYLSNNVALNKLGTPDDVANIVVFLSSPENNFATGQVWNIDGGQTKS